jgi:hypothetical protein
VEQPLLSLNEKKTQQLQGLIETSHESHMDLNSVLDWAGGADRSLPPKRADHCAIYGTPYWDALTEEQRLEVLWQENAQAASQFIWLEEALGPLFVRLLHRNDGRIPEDIREYMMIFSKEEIVHTQMFRRYLKLAGLPVYGTPEIQYFLEELVKYPPAVGVLCVYLGEAIAEEAVMRQDGPGLDPLSKRLFMEHHKEEARHLAFGRNISESYLETVGPETKGRIGFLVRSFMSSLVPEFTYSHEISQHLKFDIGIDPQDTEAIREVRLSANNRRINQERWGALLAWIKRMGLAPAEYDWFDPVPPRPSQPPQPTA